MIGVSPDKMPALEKFAAKYQLTFPLASDEGRRWRTHMARGCEKSMYGRKYMGMERSTFLAWVRTDGCPAGCGGKVSVPKHAAEGDAGGWAL